MARANPVGTLYSKSSGCSFFGHPFQAWYVCKLIRSSVRDFVVFHWFYKVLSITVRFCTRREYFSCYHRGPPMAPREEPLVFPRMFNGRSLIPRGVRSMRPGASVPRNRETCSKSIVFHWFYKGLALTVRGAVFLATRPARNPWSSIGFIRV